MSDAFGWIITIVLVLCLIGIAGMRNEINELQADLRVCQVQLPNGDSTDD